MVKRVTLRAALIRIICLTLGAGESYAHHSFAAEFDASKPVRLDGIITKADWINPHITIYLNVRRDDGVVVNWSVEAGSPNSLTRRGLTRFLLSEGTHVVIEGFQSKSGGNRATGARVALPGGLRIILDQHGSG